jgi:hypothetical protein
MHKLKQFVKFLFLPLAPETSNILLLFIIIISNTVPHIAICLRIHVIAMSCINKAVQDHGQVHSVFQLFRRLFKCAAT